MYIFVIGDRKDSKFDVVECASHSLPTINRPSQGRDQFMWSIKMWRLQSYHWNGWT